jgi:hypothetical protein
MTLTRSSTADGRPMVRSAASSATCSPQPVQPRSTDLGTLATPDTDTDEPPPFWRGLI